MTDFLNQYSGWLSIIALLATIPLGIITNIATPKVRSWLASRSIKSLKGQILYFEEMIEQTDRLITDPSFAVAKFVNFAVRAIIGQLGILMLIIGGVFLGEFYLSTLDNPSDNFLFFSLLFGAFFLGAYFFSQKTLELYAMTYRVEHYQKWRGETIQEIEQLNEQLSEQGSS